VGGDAGDQGFAGSDSISWTELAAQGSVTWVNTRFTEQNLIESIFPGVSQSLNNPDNNDVIHGNESNNASLNILGTDFQDRLALD